MALCTLVFEPFAFSHCCNRGLRLRLLLPAVISFHCFLTLASLTQLKLCLSRHCLLGAFVAMETGPFFIRKASAQTKRKQTVVAYV